MTDKNDTLVINYIGFVNTYDNTGLVDSSSLDQAEIDTIIFTSGWGYNDYYYEDSLFLFQDSFLIHFSDTLGGGYFHGQCDTNSQCLVITGASRGSKITPIDSFHIGMRRVGWKPSVCYQQKSGPFYFPVCNSFAKTTMDTMVYPGFNYYSSSIPQRPFEPCEPMFLSPYWFGYVTDSLRDALGPTDTLRIWQWFKQFE